MACAIHTVRRGDIDLNDVVVIAGRPTRAVHDPSRKIKNAKKLVVIDAIDERLELAKNLVQMSLSIH